MHRPLVVLITLLAGACAPSPLSPDEQRALAAAEVRWAARGYADYRFERQVWCGYCPPEITQWMRVDVVGGQVTQIVKVDSVGTLPAGVILFTVEQLFKSIRSANDGDHFFEDVIVEFDPQLGFPVRVSWVPDESRGTDAGIVYRLRNATPLPASPP